MFFDAYPRFYETSQTRAPQGQINLRYEAIFAQNADVFEDARVLDIASHDRAAGHSPRSVQARRR